MGDSFDPIRNRGTFFCGALGDGFEFFNLFPYPF